MRSTEALLCAIDAFSLSLAKWTQTRDAIEAELEQIDAELDRCGFRPSAALTDRHAEACSRLSFACLHVVEYRAAAAAARLEVVRRACLESPDELALEPYLAMIAVDLEEGDCHARA